MQTQARLALFAQAREGDNSCLGGRWSILLSLQTFALIAPKQQLFESLAEVMQ
jgi:hypothetical protein